MIIEGKDIVWMPARYKDLVEGSTFRRRDTIDSEWEYRELGDVYNDLPWFELLKLVEVPVFDMRSVRKLLSTSVSNTYITIDGNTSVITNSDIKIIFHDKSNITIIPLNGVTTSQITCNIGENELSISWFIHLLKFLKWKH